MRHGRGRDGLLDRSGRNGAGVKGRAARVGEFAPGAREDGAGRDGGGADEIGALDGAEALAGFQGEAAAGGGRGEGGAGAADVPCAAADDTAVCCSARCDLEGSFAGEGGSGCGGGGGGGSGGGG